ncbi:hypothetical protein PBRA_003336 [Plasmodiophora brassicae]|nr:hypothetical protein PBRA_003336 [Plasmodiophora brassicae]
MPTQFAVPAAVPPPRKVVDDDDDGDDFGPSLPTAGASHGFAVPAVPEHRPPSATEDNDDDFGPGVSPPTAAPSRSGERADAMSTIEEWRLPVTHEFTMHGHTKAVSALALERSGSRLLTGGYDYMMRLWDFNGMDKRGKAFREVEPDSGQQIVSLSYSYPAPDRVLVVTAASRAKIHDREGRPLVEFARGDMYIRDMKHTSGHTVGCVGGLWMHHDPNVVMTAAGDGTLRLWDVNRPTKARDTIKVKAARGRLPVTACTASADGRYLAAACQDGSLQIWKNDGRFNRPDVYIASGHAANTDTSSIVLTSDCRQLVSRGGDDTIKVWDLRSSKAPLKVFDDLPNFFPETDVILSPDERLIVGCVSVKRGQGRGRLVFIDRTELSVVQSVDVCDGSAVRALWSPTLNQIVVGGADFNVHVLYDPRWSTKGALLCAGKKPKRKEPMDFHQFAPAVHVFGQQGLSKKRQREKQALDPIKAKIPQIPVSGFGKGAALESTVSDYVAKHVVRSHDPRSEDPREALLRYADQAAQDPVFFGKAYAESQPVPVFDTAGVEKEMALEAEKAAKAQRLREERERHEHR